MIHTIQFIILFILFIIILLQHHHYMKQDCKRWKELREVVSKTINEIRQELDKIKEK